MSERTAKNFFSYLGGHIHCASKQKRRGLPFFVNALFSGENAPVRVIGSDRHAQKSIIFPRQKNFGSQKPFFEFLTVFFIEIWTRDKRKQKNPPLLCGTGAHTRAGGGRSIIFFAELFLNYLSDFLRSHYDEAAIVTAARTN